ncbi:hypothetical protein ACFE04_011318 [Oxalis oulophora]
MSSMVIESNLLASFLLLIALFLAFSTSSTAINITRILDQYPDAYGSFNALLTASKLNQAINKRETVTILALDKDSIDTLSGSPIEERADYRYGVRQWSFGCTPTIDKWYQLNCQARNGSTSDGKRCTADAPVEGPADAPTVEGPEASTPADAPAPAADAPKGDEADAPKAADDDTPEDSSETPASGCSMNVVGSRIGGMVIMGLAVNLLGF